MKKISFWQIFYQNKSDFMHIKFNFKDHLFQKMTWFLWRQQTYRDVLERTRHTDRGRDAICTLHETL